MKNDKTIALLSWEVCVYGGCGGGGGGGGIERENVRSCLTRRGWGVGVGRENVRECTIMSH